MIKKNGEQFSVHASNMGDDNEGAIGNLLHLLFLPRSLGSGYVHGDLGYASR